jgi:thioester reductase-like protein
MCFRQGTGLDVLHYVLKILAKSGLQASSFRIGQISGGLPNGAWATSDWIPILAKSSLVLGALPSASGVRPF